MLRHIYVCGVVIPGLWCVQLMSGKSNGGSPRHPFIHTYLQCAAHVPVLPLSGY